MATNNKKETNAQIAQRVAAEYKAGNVVAKAGTPTARTSGSSAAAKNSIYADNLPHVVTHSKAKQLYDRGFKITVSTPSGTQEYKKYGSSGQNSISEAGKYLAPQTLRYNYEAKNPEDMDLAEFTAYMRANGATEEQWQSLASSVENPGSLTYNPYWGSRSTQEVALPFFQQYFGSEDVRLDEDFFVQNVGLRAFAQYTNTGSLKTPGKYASDDEWAGYWYVKTLQDKDENLKVDQEWNDLRKRLSEEYAGYQQVYGRAPSYDELISRIDWSDYTYLQKIDNSRNIGTETSNNVLRLNWGTNYSRESLAGLYSVLKSGGDISGDRSYFEDAVQYWLSPASDDAGTTASNVFGVDVSGWTDADYDSAMQQARQSGDHETYETLKYFRWANGEHMDSLDTTDYLGGRFGYYKDDNYFKAIEETYAPVWEEMYTDESRTSVKKPTVSDSIVYHAAYQAWQDMQTKADTELVEEQAERVFAAVQSVDKTDFSSEEEYREFINDYVLDLSGSDYTELRKYMDGSLKLARDVFISQDELDAYIHETWTGGTQEEPETVVAEAAEPPYGYDEAMRRNAAFRAECAQDDAKEVANSLVALSESEASVSASQIAQSGMTVAPASILESEAAPILAAIWKDFRSESLSEKLGDAASFVQEKAVDPVLKMLAEATGADGTETITVGGLKELLVQQTVAQMGGSDVSVADGVIDAAIPDSNEFLFAIYRMQTKNGLDVLDQPFALGVYRRIYNNCKEQGYTPEDSADTALSAAMYCEPGLKAIGNGLEGDEELAVASSSLVDKVTGSEGYEDGMTLLAPIVSEAAAASEEDATQELQDFAGAMALGMSEQATAAHSATTRNLLNELMHGDISASDVLEGLKNTGKYLMQKASSFAQGVVDNARQVFRSGELGYTSAQITTERYDALDGETRASIDGVYNQQIGSVASDSEVLLGIAAYAARNGHVEGYGSGESKAIDSAGERFLSGNDFISWLGAVTNTTSEEDQEQYKVRNDLRTYGRWFTFDEAWALANAWETGYIDYDGFREVLVNRVSKFSGEYVNAINNADMLSDGTRQLRSALDDMESGIRHNLEVADARPSDELLSAANDAIAAVDSFNDPISIVENNELLRNAIGYDALVQQHGDDEMALSDAISAALKGIAESAQTENVMSDNTGAEFTLPQVDELRKAVDLYEKFGAYGYDFVMAATPEYLKKFGIDLEGEGLTASLEEYMDELTEGAWRDAYVSDGLGFVGTVNAGLVKGYQGVGNVVAGGSRMIRDVLDFLPGVTAYEEGDGSYYDRVQSVSGKVDERLATKATSFEQFAAQIVSETARNQLTGAFGAALGNMANAGKFSKHVSSAVQKAASGGTVNASGVAQLMNAATASKSAIDTAEIIARTPFATTVFTGAYNENRDKEKGVLSSLIRACLDTEIELFTETPAVDDKLDAVKNWIMPSLDKAGDGAIGYIAKLASDSFNEVGQEEISLMFERMFDTIEDVDGSKISDVKSFFSELWRSIRDNTKGMGEDAASTALSTTCITLLGSVFNLPFNSVSRFKLDEAMSGNMQLDAASLESLMSDAIMEIGEAMETAEPAAAEKEKSEYDPTNTPVFDRNGTLKDKFKDSLRDNLDEDGLAQAIEDEVAGDASETAQEATTKQETAPEQEAVAEPAPAEEARPERDPNLSAGATKVADYMDEAENATRDAIAAEAGNQAFEAAMSQDGATQTARKAYERAQEDLSREQQKEIDISMQIDTKQQQMYGIYSAAMNEGVPFNSPNVQNAVIANQQATAALRSDLAKQQEKVKLAMAACERAQKEYEEAREEAKKRYQAEAATTAKKAAMRIDEARALLQSEVAKQGLVPSDELNSKTGRRYIDDTATIPSDGDVDPRTVYNEDLSKLEKTKRTDKAVGADLDKITIRQDENGKFDFNDFADRESDAVYGALKKDVTLEESSETTGVDNRDYSIDFDLKATNLLDLFNRILNTSETNAQEYMVHVPKKVYDSLIGIFERMKNGKKYVDAFFRHSTNTDENADSRFANDRIDKTVDLARSLSSTNYDTLKNDFGMTPVAENENDVILKITGSQKGIYTSDILKAEQELKDARAEESDIRAIVGGLEASSRMAQGEEKQSIFAQKKEYIQNLEAARSRLFAAQSALREAKRAHAGFIGENYVAVQKSDLQNLLGSLLDQQMADDKNVDAQTENLYEQYDAGTYDSAHLKSILMELTDFSGMDEASAALVRKNIDGMSDAELMTEIISAWREQDRTDAAQGILKQLPYRAFENGAAMRKYVKENGGWRRSGGSYENLETKQSYYVNYGLLSLVNRYRNMLAASEDSELDLLGLSMYRLEPDDLEGFLRKTVELANAAALRGESRQKALESLAGVVESPLKDGKHYMAVDIVPAGTLRVNPKCKNSGLQDEAGNFLADRALDQLRNACNIISSREGTGNYGLYVVEEVEGQRVVRQAGKFYDDLGGRYCPTYTQIMENATEAYLKHTKTTQSGKEYADYDFSVEIGDARSDDALKDNLDAAEHLFRGMFSATGMQPSKEEFSRYAKAYLQAKKEVLEREISMVARNYRLNGDQLGDEHVRQLAEEVKAKNAELAQIRRALMNDKNLQRYIDSYKFVGNGASGADVRTAAETVVERAGVSSPEAQAARALVENAPEADVEENNAPEAAVSSEKRSVALEVDERLTQGMTAEERGDYYASRAEDAARDGDAYRYARYQREVLNAAEETGMTETEETSEDAESGENGDKTTEASDQTSDGSTADPAVRAMEEYEVSPEDQAAIDEAYPNRETKDEAELSGNSEQFTEPKPVDENTSVGGMGHDAESIEYGRQVIRQQNALIKQLNRQINDLVPAIKAEWENGASYWSSLAEEKKRLMQEMNDANGDPARLKSIRDGINRIHVAQQHSDEARESFARWTDLVGKKKALENRRNTAKQTMKVNSQMVNGTETAKQLAEGDVKYNPYIPVAGSKGNKTGLEIAKEILKDAYKSGIMKYKRRTALTVKQVAKLISDKLDDSFFAAVLQDAKIITTTRKATEMEHADDIFRMAVINEKRGNGKAEGAKDALIQAYQASIVRDDFSEGGYKEYQAARAEAREKALVKANEIRSEYSEEKSKRELDVELANLTDKLDQDAAIIANMRSVERAYYRLGNGDVEAALRGEYGGQIPVPLMNIFTGMVLDASEGKKGRKVVTREMDSTQRIVDDYTEDYAPFINAVFVNPALHTNDVVKYETNKLLDELGKKIPRKKIKVTTYRDGTPVTEKMSIREIVGHIIDERRSDAYSPELSDNDYVNERLNNYGITDTKTRKIIQEAVDYARKFNDQLYALANESLVQNGHYEHTYGYRKWYMHHYTPETGLPALLGIPSSDEEISQVFIDETGNRRPSHEWNAAALERHGDQTGYDFVESVRRSLSGVMNTIYQTGNIDRLKQLEQAINGTPKMDESGNYIYENNKVVLESRPMYEVGPDGQQVDKSYLTGFGNTIGQFAQRAANKRTGKIDRAIMESPAGRKSLAWVKLATSLRSAAAVAFNPMSAATNIAPVKFLTGICTPSEISSAMASTITQMTGTAESEDYIKVNSSFVKGRTEHSAEERAIQGKIMDAGYAMSGAVDSFTTNFMARALFNHEFNTNGGDAEVALAQTEDMLRRMLTDKSRVGRSQFYENVALGGVFGQFQQESVNELMYMLKDMRYYGGGKIPKALAMMLGVYVFNAMFNWLRGSESMSDPLGETVKAFNGLEEDATNYEKVKAVIGALGESINPIDFFASGETPVTSAVSDLVSGADKLFAGEADIWDFVSTVSSVMFPGSATIKRAATGIKSVQQGYAETTGGRVKFVTGEPNAAKYAAAAIGGVNVLPQSKDYVYGFDDALGSNQSQKFKALVNAGLDPSLAWNSAKGTANAKTQTTAANETLSDDEATAKEIQETQSAARTSREDAGMPMDVAPWAVTDGQGADESTPAGAGIALWRKYGLYTYPQVLESDAANEEYRKAYNTIVKSYLGGAYGETGTRAAAEKLETALRKARSKAKAKYSSEEETDEGGDLNGQK
ncbi:MAG: hypothetical protein ACI4AL_09785 [Aristaeellaceae bacterium]